MPMYERLVAALSEHRGLEIFTWMTDRLTRAGKNQ